MPSARDLRLEQQRLVDQMTRLDAAAGGRSFSAAEQREWDAADARIEEIKRQLTGLDADESRGRRDAASVRTVPHGPGDRAFETYLRTGDDAELRALGAGTGSAGGYFVPQGFRNRVTETLKSFSAVRRVAELVETDEGNDLPWPTVDDTGNAGAILSENTQVTEQDVTVAQKTLKAYMYTSKLVRVSLQLLQDNAVDIEAKLARWLAIRIGRAQNPHFTTGSGSSQPQGLITGGTVRVTTAGGQTSSVIYDNLVDLVHSIDPAYISEEEAAEASAGPFAGGSVARWMMNNVTWGAIRKIKDTTGKPLVEPDVQRGAPELLLGYRVVINPDMANMGASAKPIMFGNFRAGYVIRDAIGVQVLRLVERYADFLQHGFLGFQRSDGMVQDAAAYGVLQNAAS
jgi:HK97 family phage major capsid protein